MVIEYERWKITEEGRDMLVNKKKEYKMNRTVYTTLSYKITPENIMILKKLK